MPPFPEAMCGFDAQSDEPSTRVSVRCVRRRLWMEPSRRSGNSDAIWRALDDGLGARACVRLSIAILLADD